VRTVILLAEVASVVSALSCVKHGCFNVLKAYFSIPQEFDQTRFDGITFARYLASIHVTIVGQYLKIPRQRSGRLVQFQQIRSVLARGSQGSAGPPARGGGSPENAKDSGLRTRPPPSSGGPLGPLARTLRLQASAGLHVCGQNQIKNFIF
jgi:hypothetical protein